jgi:pyridoxal phosphate enzyme (YggS family)
MHDLAAHLERVRERIADAATRAGRAADAPTLIAVSKTYPVDAIQQTINAGQRVFGESTTQEALAKIAHFADAALEWHFIGHLQSNKAKLIPGHFAWLHSLDSLRLAQRLSRLAQEQNARLNVLIEVNVARDPAKHGIMPDALPALMDALLRAALPALSLRGLMTIGPHGAGEAASRRVFATLRELGETTRRRYSLPDFTELSMGMSDDYVEGVLEGSTMLRVGTAIFGERHYASE